MQNSNRQPGGIAPAQWYVVALVAAFTTGSILYKLLRHEQLMHSIVGSLMDWERKKQRTSLRSAAALLLLPLCLEGTTPTLTINRMQSAEATRIIASSANQVETRLADPLNIAAPLPTFLRIGFPRPLSASGSGLAIGDTRTIHFSGAEGDPPGDLLMRVTARRPGYARFGNPQRLQQSRAMGALDQLRGHLEAPRPHSHRPHLAHPLRAPARPRLVLQRLGKICCPAGRSLPHHSRCHA